LKGFDGDDIAELERGRLGEANLAENARRQLEVGFFAWLSRPSRNFSAFCG